MAGGSAHFVALDWLRGVAALLVLGLHVGIATGVGAALFARGYLAVDLFFVISGFVVAEAYGGMLGMAGGWRRFVAVRAIRLYPMVAMGSALGLVEWLTGRMGTHHLAVVFLCQLLLVPQLWQGGSLFLLDSVLWSLMLEVAANAVHALSARRLTLPVLAATVALGWVAVAVSAYEWGSLSVGYARPNAPGGIARVAFGYGAGVLLSRLRRDGRLPAVRLPAWLVLLLPLALLLPGLPWWRDRWFADLAMVTALPAMVAAAIGGALPRGVHRLAHAAGRLSYPLYAVHLPLLTGALAAIRASGVAGPARTAALAASVLAIAVIAHLVESWYDAPLRDRLSARLVAGAPRAPAATAP